MKLGLLITLFTSLASLASSSAADYIHPDESKELFKVEKIPLQVHQIKEASHHLTILALGTQGGSPAKRRCTGQLLALAIRLDYANQDARVTSHKLRDGKPTQSPEPQDILKAQTQIRILQNWLALPTSGKNANTLANYLADATRLQDEATKNNPDQADWTGLLPPLLSYAEKTVETPVTEPSDTPEPALEPVIENPYQIAQLTTSISTASDIVLEKVNPQIPSRRALRRRLNPETEYYNSRITINISSNNAPLTLTVKSLEKTEEESVEKTPTEGTPTQEATTTKNSVEEKPAKELSKKHKELTQALKNLETRLNRSPQNQGASVSIQLPPENQYSAINSHSISAAVQLMLTASLANTALRDDTILCAALNPSGNLTLPAHFWQTVYSLRKDKKSTGRLIVPQSTANILTQLLVLGDSDFFARWEVYSVTTIDEAYQIAIKDSQPAMAESETLFQAVRRVSATRPVASLALNKSFQTQLKRILKLTPNHLSAKTLLLQGSSKRPTRLSPLGQAHEVQLMAQYMQAQLNRVELNFLSPSVFIKLYERLYDDLNDMQRIIHSRDELLYKQTRKISYDLETIKNLFERNHTPYSNLTKSKLRALISKVKNDTDKLVTQVNFIIYDSTTNQ